VKKKDISQARLEVVVWKFPLARHKFYWPSDYC